MSRLNVWYAIPSANYARCMSCFDAWEAQGCRCAVLLDFGALIPRNAEVFLQPREYPGYFASVNQLAFHLLERHGADIVVAGGDDMFPDPKRTAQEIAEQYLARFPDGFGVMQPTGDDLDGTDRICGSPWFGRGWIQRANGGRGPFWPEYRAFFGDEELKTVAEAQGVLWQRPDLVQRHEHWSRPGAAPKTAYQARNDGLWNRDETIFKVRRGRGFPGSAALEGAR